MAVKKKSRKVPMGIDARVKRLDQAIIEWNVLNEMKAKIEKKMRSLQTRYLF